MADTPELILPMQPGVDHPRHADGMRTNIAKNLGVRVEKKDVTPSDEVADNMITEAQNRFLENVARVEQPPGETAGPQKANSSSGFDNLIETVRADTPGVGDDLDTSRTTPSGPLADLEDARNAKMTPQREAA